MDHIHSVNPFRILKFGKFGTFHVSHTLLGFPYFGRKKLPPEATLGSDKKKIVHKELLRHDDAAIRADLYIPPVESLKAWVVVIIDLAFFLIHTKRTRLTTLLLPLKYSCSRQSRPSHANIKKTILDGKEESSTSLVPLSPGGLVYVATFCDA